MQCYYNSQLHTKLIERHQAVWFKKKIYCRSKLFTGNQRKYRSRYTLWSRHTSIPKRSHFDLSVLCLAPTKLLCPFMVTCTITSTTQELSQTPSMSLTASALQESMTWVLWIITIFCLLFGISFWTDWRRRSSLDLKDCHYYWRPDSLLTKLLFLHNYCDKHKLLCIAHFSAPFAIKFLKVRIGSFGKAAAIMHSKSIYYCLTSEVYDISPVKCDGFTWCCHGNWAAQHGKRK